MLPHLFLEWAESQLSEAESEGGGISERVQASTKETLLKSYLPGRIYSRQPACVTFHVYNYHSFCMRENGTQVMQHIVREKTPNAPTEIGKNVWGWSWKKQDIRPH